MPFATAYPSSAVKLLDHAMSTPTAISPESALLAEDVRNPSLSLVDRLESYEDIANIEVGDTNLSRARNVEREVGLRQLYLKFEGNNPTGTQKDRIAFAQCLDAMRRGYDCVTVATCGNYGAAIALAARLANLKSVICIPQEYTTQRIKELEEAGAEIRRIPGSYEVVVEHSKQLSLARMV